MTIITPNLNQKTYSAPNLGIAYSCTGPVSLLIVVYLNKMFKHTMVKQEFGTLLIVNNLILI